MCVMLMVMPRTTSSGARSIRSNGTYAAVPRSARTLVIAAVRVVLPWSTWPIVPMLRCGLVRAYACLGMFLPPVRRRPGGNRETRVAGDPPPRGLPAARLAGGRRTGEGSASQAGRLARGQRARRVSRFRAHRSGRRHPGRAGGRDKGGAGEHAVHHGPAGRRQASDFPAGTAGTAGTGSAGRGGRRSPTPRTSSPTGAPRTTWASPPPGGGGAAAPAAADLVVDVPGVPRG